MRKNLKRFVTTAIILALLTGCAGSNANDAGKTGDAGAAGAAADGADNILTHDEAAENMEESGSEPLSGADAAGNGQASSGEVGSGTDASAGADAKKKPEELLGTKFPDFTMKTVDGGTFTLSEALKEKQVVLINMFATWCGPCKMEFPEMIRSYEERKDYVDVFAFSHDHENGDSEEKLKKFAEDFKLPFHVAYDDDLALDTFSAFRGIPATIVVDRFGTICFVQSGCFFNKGQIDRVLDTFIGDDYTESKILTDVPKEVVKVEYPDNASLSAAMNAEGGTLVFESDPDKVGLPFIPTEMDGRTAAVASGGKALGNDALVCTKIQVTEDGSVLAFDLKSATNIGYYNLLIFDNDKPVKAYSGTHDWDTCAVELAKGDHEIWFAAYRMEIPGDEKIEDLIAVDEVRLLTGDEAAQVLAAQPVYPSADEASLRLEGENVREVKVFKDESEYPFPFFIGTGELTVHFQLPAGAPVETYIVYTGLSETPISATECVSDDRSEFVFKTDLDWEKATKSHAMVEIFTYYQDGAAMNAMIYPNEEVLDRELKDKGLTWEYAE